jgi:CheY-like chemotaxis protein
MDMSQRILIVEDDPRSLFALRAVLEQHGFEVVATANANEAAAMDATALRAALIDLRLPEMPGDELARGLRKKNPQLKLMFMTAYAPAKIDGGLEDATVLIKPLQLDQVLKMLA